VLGLCVILYFFSPASFLPAVVSAIEIDSPFGWPRHAEWANFGQFRLSLSLSLSLVLWYGLNAKSLHRMIDGRQVIAFCRFGDRKLILLPFRSCSLVILWHLG